MPTPRLVPLHQLLAPPEPLRVSMADGPMEDLKRSITELGILEPLLVAPKYLDGKDNYHDAPIKGRHKGADDADAYEIIDGHRRYVVAEALKLPTVPVMIFEDAGQAKYAIMLHANICREDVTPYEEGVQFLELATKYNWSMDDLMKFFRQSEDYINDRVDVARRDPAVAAAVRDRLIGLGHAKEILKCQDESWRPYLLEQAAVHGATVGGLREMRRHHEDELRQAQGQLPLNASPQFVEGAVLPPDECIWCGRTDDPSNIVRVPVHQYHQADLRAALETIGLRALIKPAQ